MTRTLDAFEKVFMQTECIFARKAKIEGPDNVCPASTDPADYIRQSVNKFFNFCDRCKTEPLDGFVFAFGSVEAGSSIRAVNHLLRCVFTTLGEIDADASECLAGDLLREGWRFRCRGCDFFTLVIAPCYDKSNARYGFDCTETFILLQPFESFGRHRPSSHNRIPDVVRETIRTTYAKAGRPYDATINKCPHEALRFVKPEVVGEAPIRWWEE